MACAVFTGGTGHTEIQGYINRFMPACCSKHALKKPQKMPPNCDAVLKRLKFENLITIPR